VLALELGAQLLHTDLVGFEVVASGPQTSG
jgi:hypothetical protein